LCQSFSGQALSRREGEIDTVGSLDPFHNQLLLSQYQLGGWKTKRAPRQTINQIVYRGAQIAIAGQAGGRYLYVLITV
jgi:hypothetical protein